MRKRRPRAGEIPPPTVTRASEGGADARGASAPRGVSLSELRARVNALALIVSAMYEQLSLLQRSLRMLRTDPPKPDFSIRRVGPGARAEAPWDEISAPDEDGGAGRE